MGQTINFITTQQAFHLALAARLLGAKGFQPDAKAVAIYLPGEGDRVDELQAIAIFEDFKAGRADLRFATVRPDAVSREIVAAVSMISSRYFGVSDLSIVMPEREIEVICALLRCGFKIQGIVRGFAEGEDSDIVLSLASAGPRVIEQRPLGRAQE